MHGPRTLSTLLIGAVAAATLAMSSGVVTAATCWSSTKLEKRFAGKVNFKRAQTEVPKLKLDPELSKVARTHSRAMERKGAPFHSSREQLSTRITNWKILAENVGAGFTVKSVWRKMLEGPFHENNLIDTRFTFMGVGVTKDRAKKYITIVFEGTKNPGTILDMPSC